MSIWNQGVRRRGRKRDGGTRPPDRKAPVPRRHRPPTEGTTTMRFLGYTLGDPSTPISPREPEMYAEIGNFIEEATKAGVLLATGRLPPVDESTRVTNLDGKFTVIDG